MKRKWGGGRNVKLRTAGRFGPAASQHVSHRDPRQVGDRILAHRMTVNSSTPPESAHMSDATCGGQPTAGRPYFARILPRLSRRVRVGCRVSDPSNFENHQRFQFDIGDTADHNQIDGDDVMICTRDAALMRITKFVCGALPARSQPTLSLPKPRYAPSRLRVRRGRVLQRARRASAAHHWKYGSASNSAP